MKTLYVCIFVIFVLKTGYSKCEIYIFFINKKNTELKINMLENHQSLSLSFFGKKKDETSRSGRVTRLDTKNSATVQVNYNSLEQYNQKACTVAM